MEIVTRKTAEQVREDRRKAEAEKAEKARAASSPMSPSPSDGGDGDDMSTRLKMAMEKGGTEAELYTGTDGLAHYSCMCTYESVNL